MGNVGFVVDGRVVYARQGQSVLHALLDAGVYVPHACASNDNLRAPASCRMCFVQVEGVAGPVCACEVQVTSGMVVSTGTPDCKRLARRSLSLLMESHRASCKECPRAEDCEFRRAAQHLDMSFGQLARLGMRKAEGGLGEAHEQQAEPNSCVGVLHDKCIRCGRCVAACEQAGIRAIAFVGRGAHMRIAIDRAVLLDGARVCKNCTLCLRSCQAGALFWIAP